MIQDVRNASRGVFNAPFRLEIAAAVHRLGKEDFTTSEVTARLEFDLPEENNVGRNLKKLIDAGLLRSLDGLWTRTESVFWVLCEDWYRELVELRGVSTGRRKKES